jgi:hypothetical protein
VFEQDSASVGEFFPYGASPTRTAQYLPLRADSASEAAADAAGTGARSPSASAIPAAAAFKFLFTEILVSDSISEAASTRASPDGSTLKI